MKNLMKRLFVEEEGQGMVEYAIIVAIVSVGVIVALIAVKGQLNTLFTKISQELAEPTGKQTGTN